MSTRRGDWIQTYTGRAFWPLDATPEDVSIQDIAHALCMKCRFNGHCRFHYSVGQHSFMVACQMPTKELQLWGLLHDAAEAYLPDVCRPIKPHLAGFAEIEERLLQVILRRFGLSGPIPEEIKRADDVMLATEARDVMAPPPADWKLSAEALPLLPGNTPRIRQLDPEYAKTLYLEMFRTVMASEVAA